MLDGNDVSHGDLFGESNKTGGVILTKLLKSLPIALKSRFNPIILSTISFYGYKFKLIDMLNSNIIILYNNKNNNKIKNYINYIKYKLKLLK